MRVCFFGDSFVNGTGDEACQGWVGRICAWARQGGRDVTCYNLGIRRETSADIARRWQVEASARLPGGIDGGLVFSFGINDCTMEGEGVRVAPEAALANAQMILRAAASFRPTLMVGPPPVADCDDTDRRVAALSKAFQGLCAGLGVPYLDIHPTLARDEQWRRNALAGDGVHPDGSGYEQMARLVHGWDGWRAWMAYSPDATDPS